MSLIRISLIAACSIALCGCSFSREIVNPEVRALDVSWIEPGVTTKSEVVARLGFPPTVRGLSEVSKDQFRWTTLDTFTKSFVAGYILTPTFEFSDEDYADDILIRFDAEDRVSLVSRMVIREGRLHQSVWKEAKR